MRLAHNIIILGGHTSALYTARSFGRLGSKIGIIDDRSYCEARFSKYCSEFYNIRKFDKPALLNAINRMAEKLGPSAIFPTSDETVKLLSQSKHDLPEHHLAMIPDWATTEIAYDKKKTYALAREHGVSVPETYYPDSLEDVRHIGGQCQFPVIVKPSTTVDFRRVFGKKAVWAKNTEQLESVFQSIAGRIPLPTLSIQEFIAGPNTNFRDYVSCFANGKPAFDCTYTRGRQFPIDFGTATHCNYVHHEELREIGRRLLAATGFWGVSSAQFKYDSERKRHYFFDLNARPWKCIGILETFGINLPLIAYQLRIGVEPDVLFEPPTQPHVWVDLLPDLYVSFRTMISGELTIKDWLASYRGKRIGSTFSRDDPMPGLILLLIAPWLLVRGMR